MDAAWRVGGGEMGGRIRDHDWSGTALGPIAAWPQSLRTAVDLLLDSGFPAVITWGPDGLLLYNTGYVGIIGSHHPAALGEPSVDQFPDAWPAFEPVCERVWAGDIVTLVDRLYPLMRGGVLEHAWFTVSNSPLRDERGAITGIYSTMIETTSRMRSEIALRQNDERQTLLLGLMRNQRSLTAPDRMMEAAATAIGRYLGADRTGFFELDGGDTATYGPGWVNGTLPLLTGSFDASETGAGYLAEVRAGRTQGIADLDQDPVTTHSMFIEIGARTGIRTPIIRNGRWRAGLDVHQARVREWIPEDIALIREVADQTWDAVERQRADAALRKSRAQLERQAQFLDTTLSSVSDLILMWDQDGHVVYANRALERLWDMTPAQYLGKTTEELGYPPELNERFAQEIAQVIQTRAAVAGEVPYTSPTGQFGYFDYVFSPVMGESGEIEFVACAAHDSTERRQSEAALRESEARYRALLESIDQGFCTIEMIMDGQGKPVDYLFLEVNPAFAQYTGLEGVVGKRMRDLHPDHEDFWFEAYGQVMLSGEPMRFEAEAAQLNRWYGVLAYRVGDPHPRRVAVLFEDITERKQADEALLESEARFRAIANVVPDLLWSNDLTGRATWCKQRMLDYVGMSFDTLRAFGWLDVIHPADRDQSYRHYAANISVGQAFQREHRLRRHDGVYRWFLARAEPMLDEAGQTVQWFGTCSDIHEARMA